MRQPIPNCIRDNASLWFGWRRGLRERFGLLCFFFLILGALALLASPASATISLVQSKSNEEGGGGNNYLSVSLPSATTPGNLLIFAMFYASGGTSPVMNVCDGTATSCTAPNAGCTGQTSTDTFTALPNMPVNAGVRQTYVAYAKASGALTSFTGCGAAGGHSTLVAVYEYHSTAGWQSSPLDTSNTNSNTTGTTGSGGSITPSASGELIFSAIAVQAAVTGIAVSSGYTQQPTSNGASGTGWLNGNGYSGDGCDNENSGNTSTTCTFTWTGSNAWGAAIAAFKPSTSTPITRRGQTIIGTLLPRGEGQPRVGSP